MGWRSGEFPGQSITFNFASWKSSSLFQMKDTGQYPIGIFLHHQEMPFLYWLFSLITSIYLYKFIIPSISISAAKFKLPQNIFLGFFTSSLQWAGFNCSRFLILINPLYSLEQKMTCIWKQHFFRFSAVQYLGYLLHILSFSTSLRWAASHCTWTSVNSACTKSFCKSKLVFLAYLLQWLFGYNFSVTKA